MSLSLEYRRRRILLSFCCLVLLSILFNPIAQASDIVESPHSEIWLVTYGPGEIYWQRFGHNAIWIRDPELGLDHVFNFGFFDFDQEDFFLRFLQGRMLYFSAARPAREEFAAYINENRSIRAQRLDLSPEQKLAMTEYLLQEVRPENRDYLYDYYKNNCSTRVRDVIDQTLGGMLEHEFGSTPAPQTWRDHTRRLTFQDFWLYLGLEIGLGANVDLVISRWDEMFVPAMLAQALESVEYVGAGPPRPLVLEDVMLNRSSSQPPPLAPPVRWPLYLLAATVAAFALGLACTKKRRKLALLLSRGWLLVSGLVGLLLLFFWFGTDHSVARLNLNLLVFNPLWLIFAFWKGQEKFAFQLIAGLSLLAILMNLLPPGQYTLDVLAAFLPLNLAAGVVLLNPHISPGRTPV